MTDIQATQTHTPGPWTYAYGQVYAGNPEDIDGVNGGISIGHADRNEERTRPTERDANARLMAAAPELLDALHVALDALWELSRAADGDDVFSVDPWNEGGIGYDAIRELRDVIGKVAG
jgi:hypothetical protein